MNFKDLFYLPWLLIAVSLAFTSCEEEDLSDNNSQEEVSSDIDENTTWSDRVSDPDRADYVIKNSLEVNADLTIEPGVRVEFEEDVFMYVGDGALIAEGTSDNRITLTSSNETGDINWGGVFITSSDSRNTLAYADVKYAGGTEQYYGVDKKSAIGLKDDGKLKLKHSAISKSEGYGLYVRHGELEEFEDNEFNDNEAQGIGADMSQAAMIDGNTTFSGNTYAVEIFESELSEGDELTLANLAENASYYVTGKLEVNSGLNIEPGAIFEFKEDKMMSVFSDGMLKANAEGEEPIVFTSAKSDAGIHWKGIEIQSSNTRNELNNVEISYAGNSDWYFGEDKKAALALKDDGKVMLKNSEISNSKGYGMYTRYGELTEFENNTFTENEGTAIGLYADLNGMMDEATSFSENGWDGVEIVGSNLTKSAKWVQLNGNASYLVSGHLEIEDNLEIAPGATFEFDVDKELKVISGGGSLNAQGNSSSKITFTRSTEGASWSGIHIRSSSSMNKLDHVEVLYAGGQDVYIGGNVYAAISGNNNAVLEMTNSTVANSGGNGIYWVNGSTINDVETDNSFSDNEKENVVIEE